MNASYTKLKKIFSKASISSDIEGILHWDMATMMPSNSREQRAEQLAFMSKLKHNLLSTQEVTDLIKLTDYEKLNFKDRANFSEMKREHLFSSSLPEDLVEALSKTSAKCEGAWQNARKESNYNLVKDPLKELINLTKQNHQI